jgi:hypothetical protein
VVVPADWGCQDQDVAGQHCTVDIPASGRRRT